MEARGGPRSEVRPTPPTRYISNETRTDYCACVCVCVCASPLRNAPWCWWELVLIKGSRWWSRCVREESQKGQERCVTHHCRVLPKLKGVMSPEPMKIPPDANDCNGFSLCTREVRLSGPGPDWLRPWVFTAPFDFSASCLTFGTQSTAVHNAAPSQFNQRFCSENNLNPPLRQIEILSLCFLINLAD